MSCLGKRLAAVRHFVGGVAQKGATCGFGKRLRSTEKTTIARSRTTNHENCLSSSTGLPLLRCCVWILELTFVSFCLVDTIKNHTTSEK